MKKIENDCVHCPQGCIHCGRNKSVYYYCDKCGDCVDPDELYKYEGQDLCEDCLKAEVPTLKSRLISGGEW